MKQTERKNGEKERGRRGVNCDSLRGKQKKNNGGKREMRYKCACVLKGRYKDKQK